MIDPQILLQNQQPLQQVTLPSVARARALENQQRELQVQSLAESLKDKQAFRTAMQQSGGDVDKALSVYAQFSPEHALDLQRIQVAKAQQQRIEADAQMRDTEKRDQIGRERQKQFDVGLWQAVEGAQTPEDKQAIFDQFTQQAKADGLRDIPQGLNALKPRALRYFGEDLAKAALVAPKPTDFTLNPGDTRYDPTGKVIATAPKPETPAKVAYQQKDVLLDGKPAVVNFDPTTGKSVLPTGEDVSGRVRPMPPASVLFPKPEKPGLSVDSTDVQTTAKGVKYVDSSGFTATEKAAAREAAQKAGALFLSKDEASALHDIDSARRNQKAIIDQIESLLPKDPAQRVGALVKVPLSRALQTDAQKAAFSSWRTAAIQTLRATAGSKGLRINQAEIAQAVENDIPRLTDTLETAQQKIKNINTLLDNAEAPIIRGQTGAATSSGGGGEWVDLGGGVRYRKK